MLIRSLMVSGGDCLAELEHMNANFIRAMGQYEELRNGPPLVQAQRKSCSILVRTRRGR